MLLALAGIAINHGIGALGRLVMRSRGDA
jgi:hypothetical protein